MPENNTQSTTLIPLHNQTNWTKYNSELSELNVEVNAINIFVAYIHTTLTSNTPTHKNWQNTTTTPQLIRNLI